MPLRTPNHSLLKEHKARKTTHADPSSYITHGALGGIGAVLLRALKAGMLVWERERGRDVRLLGLLGEFVFEWGEWDFCLNL